MNYYPIEDTLYQLKELSTVLYPDKIDWAKEDAWVVDAVRGSVKETFWRGTLKEYFQSNPLQPMIQRAITRLKNLTDFELPSIMMVPYNMGLGTYGWKYNPEIIECAHNLGVRFIDTAESYGYGRVEDELGKVIRGLPDLFIATKVARNHLSYQNTLRASKRSQHKLNRVDLYQAHYPNHDISGTMQAMLELKNNGDIGLIGVSNYSIDQYLEAAYHVLPHPITSIQVRYNLLDRGIERALLPWCHQHGINVIAYSPLGQDFSKLHNHPTLDHIARRGGITTAQVALSWLMRKFVIPIPRTNKLEHLVELVDATNIQLAPEHIAMLEEAFPVTE